MEIEELEKKHEEYSKKQDEWKMFQAAYEGARSLVKLDILQTTEDQDQDLRRESKAYGFGYSPWVINKTNDFISMYPFTEILPSDEIFDLFINDCDKHDSDWTVFWNDARKSASVFGKVGIFVNKSSDAEVQSLKDQKEQANYPYLTTITPLQLYDWIYRNQGGKPVLEYIKFKDDFNVYHLWWEDKWEKYIIDEEGNVKPDGKDENPLGYIPLTWFYSTKHVNNKLKGISDIAEIAYIDASIVRDLVNTDDIIFYAAYPMLALPKITLDNNPTSQIEVGPNRVLPFSAEGSQKPFWLSSETADAIGSIHAQIEKKEKQIIRMADLSSIWMSESVSARSAESMQESFKFLESRLSNKIDNEVEARKAVIGTWLDWEQKTAEYQVSHDKRFDVEYLLTTIQDAIVAKGLIPESRTFQNELKKRTARLVVRGMSDETLDIIDGEIEDYIVPTFAEEDNVESENEDIEIKENQEEADDVNQDEAV